MENQPSSLTSINPFDKYPKQGRSPLGKLNTGDNTSRHHYGLKLYKCIQHAICAYCGIDFTEGFTYWMILSVDHVIPSHLARVWSIPEEWYKDMINCVFCCRACNELDNRNKLEGLSYTPPQKWTLEEFLSIRDRAFLYRFQKIARRREEEQEFYTSTWRGKI